MTQNNLAAKQGFSGEPLARWCGSRNMVLDEEFFYIDPKGRKWISPKGSYINGATIPQFLWDSLGGPYSGRYRRASVVHDVAVGELCNPDVPYEKRKPADRMFYHACRFDGCSIGFALILYMGVRAGSYWSGISGWYQKLTKGEFENLRGDTEAIRHREAFWGIVNKAKTSIDESNLLLLTEDMEEDLLENLDSLINDELSQKFI